MSAPIEDPKAPKIRTVLAPLPSTRRGYGIVLNASAKEGKMIYTNGRTVVIRSIKTPSDAVTFTEHKAAVSCAVFSPSGFWVASGDVEGNVLIWSWPQMKVKATFQVAKSVSDLDWDADSTRLIAGGDGALKAKVFSWDSGNNLGEITMHSHPVISCSYRKIRPFRVVTAAEDLAVNMYAGPPFKYSTGYKGHARYPNGVRYSPDGARFASVGADSKVVLYDGSTGTVLLESSASTVGAHSGAIYAFAWSPDSTQIITASADRTAKIWSASDLTVQSTFTFGPTIQDQQVGALWTEEEIITVSLSGAMNYLDRTNPAQPKKTIHGHQTTIQSIALAQSTGSFYTAALSGEVAKWNLSTGDASWLTGEGHSGKVVSIVLVAVDGKTLFTYGLDDKIRASAIETDAIDADGGELGGLPLVAAASPSAPSITVVGLAQDKLVLVDGIEVKATLHLPFTPTAITFALDGQSVFVGGKDRKIHVYSVCSGTLQELRTLIAAHDKPVTSIRFAPNGTLMVSTDSEASVYIHALPTFELKNKSGWRFHQAAVKDSDWAPDSSKIVTSSMDTHMIVWRDLTTFEAADRSRVKDTHIDGVNYVRFWDKNTIISVGADRTIKVWTIVD